jgi:hypothetical protein
LSPALKKTVAHVARVVMTVAVPAPVVTVRPYVLHVAR